MLLRIDGAGKSFGPKDVLKDVTFQLDKGERVGLVGRNGTGKTTLLKIIMGQVKPDVGDVRVATERIGYLAQLPAAEESALVSDVVGAYHGKAARIVNRIAELEAAMASPPDGFDWNAAAEEYGRLKEEYATVGGYESSSKAREALARVGLPEEFYSRKMGTLSGGELTKVMLARVIVQAQEADLLLMDEPTSHLDVGTVEWLERFLLEYKGGVIAVSHDRYFLDAIASSIIELRGGTSRTYSGNYTAYAEKRRLDDERLELAHEKAVAEKARHVRVAEEMYARSSFGTTHKTRQRMADRVEVVDGPTRERSSAMSIAAADKSGKDVVIASGLSVSRGGGVLVGSASFGVESGDKLGIFGPNGSGKSTLLKALLGDVPHSGELWVAPGAKLGYFAQGHEVLNPGLTPEEQLISELGEDAKARSRAVLSRLLIAGKDAERPISTLSGGERARVALALLLARERNLLILDEPTNYLDIEARAAVESALSDYEGTVILVTHDRYLLDSVCNKVGELSGGRFEIFSGTYSQYKGRRVHRVTEEADAYRVVAGFTDWTTKRKYAIGERVVIASSEQKNFEWALATGKLRRIRSGELKTLEKDG